MNPIEALSKHSAASTDESCTSSVISVRNLKRTYQVGGSDVLALRGVDLALDERQFLGIVGVSGSGKSTLLHLIGGLDSPDEGDIIVAGQHLNQLTPFKMSLYRRQTIGFVFQSFYLVPNLTAIENIRLALTLQGVYGDERLKLADAAIERVGMSHRKDHNPSQLSGGEQQRITVARAIVNRPSVLLADEPTGNLDRATAKSLLQLLTRIRDEDGTTILIVTHDESLAEEFCDRVVRMQDGKFISNSETTQ